MVPTLAENPGILPTQEFAGSVIHHINVVGKHRQGVFDNVLVKYKC